MQKLYAYIPLLLFLLASCADEEYATVPASRPGEGCRITFSIPTPMETATRSLGDELTSDYVTGKDLFVLVFDEYGFFSAFEKATVNDYDPDSRQGTYTVDLPPADGKCILHFVLGLEETDFDTYTPDDSEASIFSRLSVGNRKDAYWQRVEVEHVVKTIADDGVTVTAISAPPLTDNGHIVKLVRNFAQVSVDTDENVESPEPFSLQGFTVINEINRGTVAPYWGEGNYGGFASFEITDASDQYGQFTTLNEGYGGCNPPREGSELQGDTPGENNFTPSGQSEYVYERNQDNAQNPAYVLVKASYDGATCYYKLDIVKFDPATYITSYLNLYRNFHYKMHIKKVSGKGYDTPQEAMEAVASNNISASVEISDVNKIEDGAGNSLEVSELEIMITEVNSRTLTYDYKENGQSLNGQEYVQVTPIGGNDEGGYNHDAVESITWSNGVITITPANPLPGLMETQEFIVAGRNGLSRRVTVNVRQPFVFDAVDCDNVEKQIGAEMTLVVRLPENMPTSAFPLTLDIEPEKKSIYPDVLKNRIPVTSQGDYTFSYQATVTYNDYRQNPAFFFHFKSNMADSATRIVVTNPYFRNDDENSAIPEEDKTNVTSFENVEKTYDFLNLKLTGVGFDFSLVSYEDDNGEKREKYLFPDYNSQNKEVTLEFRLHNEGDGYTPSAGNEEHIVEVFADYFDLATATSNTGTITMRSDGQGILYEPSTITGMHYITFRVTRDLANETIQLSSLDHNTAALEYGTPPLTVTLQYSHTYNNNTTINYVPEGTTVSIYRDADGMEDADNGHWEYEDELITDEKRTDRQGQIELQSFAGFEETDVLIFRCTVRVQTGRYQYRNRTFEKEISVANLLENPSLVLEYFP